MPVLQSESILAICQRALGLAESRNRFTSLEDGSEEAFEARLRYDQRRRAVLEMLDWRFARRRVVAQSVAAPATPDGLTAAWARPVECIRIRGLFTPGCSTPLRHMVEDVIYTAPATPVQIVYTFDAQNPELFPPMFTQALEHMLAADFAMIFARSVNRMEVLRGLFRDILREADQIEAAERSEDSAYADGPWVDATSGFWPGY
jgi:hypothetical protein